MPSRSTQTRRHADNRLKKGGRIMVSKVKKPKYKGAKGNTFVPAYSAEIFQYELPPQTANFGAVMPAPGTQAKNTKVFLGALYNRNVPSSQLAISGKNITPKFYTDKYRVSFNNIVPDHVDSARGFLLRMHVVQVKISPYKAGVRTDTLNNWAADIEALVNKEVVESNLSADYLEFSHKNRNLNIISTELVKPDRNGMIRLALKTGTSDEIYSAPPPMCRTINHRIPTFKQKDASGDSTTPQSILMLDQMYIPAVVFTCENLTTNTGAFTIEHSSKFYFTDV